MDGRKLVRMANEIASFFEADPDRAAVIEGVAGHLKRFWDPRMRRQIVQWLDDQGGEGMKDVVVAAIKANRERLVPPA